MRDDVCFTVYMYQVVCVFSGYNVPTGNMPGCMLWIAGLFDGGAKQMYSQLHIEHRYDTRRVSDYNIITAFSISLSHIPSRFTE